MPCFYPQQVWRSKEVNPSGKRSMVFNRKQALMPECPEYIPCRKCISCKLRKSAEWATRIVHESRFYDDCIFLTLTFNDKFLPTDCGLHYIYFQKFMKRLRRKFTPKCPYSKDEPELRKEWLRKNSIKFYMCGEYGAKTNRPHFHVILFNFFPTDFEFYKNSNGFPLYLSKSIESLWSDPVTGESYGYAPFGDVTFESAAYVARYTLKKLSGDESDVVDPVTGLAHYQRANFDTGEVYDVSKEFSHMSNRPGIGSAYWAKYNFEVRNNKRPIIDGKTRPMPQYYDKLYERDFPEEFKVVKAERRRLGEARVAELVDYCREYSRKHNKRFTFLEYSAIIQRTQELASERLVRNLN